MIVEAVGIAQAASQYRSRPAFAAELEAARKDAVLTAQRDGITNPDAIRYRIMEAQIRVERKYKQLDAMAAAKS